MKRKRMVSIIIILVIVLQSVLFASAQEPNSASVNGLQETKKNMLVMYKNNQVETKQLSSGEIKKLKFDSNVEYIEEDGYVEKLDDKITWNLKYINSPTVQDLGYKGEGVKVAVFDTGIDTSNSDLSVTGGVSFVEGIQAYSDDNGHGTAMAGILAASKNNTGLLGVAPSIDLYSVKVLDSNGQGTYSGVIKGIEWAINNDIDIISMSFGGKQYSKILEKVIERAAKKDILIIAASGNDGAESIDIPARYNSVLCVGAVDKNGQIASFSNRGKELDVVAPGVDIETTALGKGTAVISGTSAAVPHVAGVAAQLLSAKPSMRIDELKAVLYMSSKPAQENNMEVYGWGIIDSLNSLYNIDENLKLEEKKNQGKGEGSNGTVTASYKVSGDNQTIYTGQRATVSAGFYSAHTSCVVTVESPLWTVQSTTTYNSIAAGSTLTYTTPIILNPGTYYVRYYTPDNGTHQYDDVFTINVIQAPAPTDDHGNTFGTATNLGTLTATETTRGGTIETAGDYDFFRFTAPTTGAYVIKTLGSTDTMGQLYDSNQNPIGSEIDDVGDRNFIINANLTANATYYVRVRGYNDSSTGSYTFSVTKPAAPTDDHGNTFGTATNLGTLTATETTRGGIIETAGDYDFFRFTAPTTGAYVIKTLGSTDTMGQLYDSNQNPIGSEIDDVGDTNFIINANLTANTTYYVRVRGYNDSSTGSYTFSVTKPAAATADLIISRVNYTGTINPQVLTEGRGGFFTVFIKNNGSAAIPATSNVRIELKNGSTLVAYRVFTLPQTAVGQEHEISLDIVGGSYIYTPGTVTFTTTVDTTNVVTESNESNNSISETFTVLTDDNESQNNTISGAVNLTLGTSYESKIYDSSDSGDWYSVTIPVGTTGNLYSQLMSPGDIFTGATRDYDLLVYDNNGNLLTMDISYYVIDSIRYKLTSGGTFYICVKPKSGQYKNDSFYSLRAEVESTTTSYGGEQLGWSYKGSKLSAQTTPVNIFYSTGLNDLWDTVNNVTYGQLMDGGIGVWNNAGVRVPSSTTNIFNKVTTQPTSGYYITAQAITDTNVGFIASYQGGNENGTLTYYKNNMINISLPGITALQSGYAIAAHELGHSLGMKDLYVNGEYTVNGVLINNVNKLMFGYGRQELFNNKFADGSLRYLHDKDIEGIRQIQGWTTTAMNSGTRFAHASYVHVSDEQLLNDSYMILRGKVKKVVDSKLSNEFSHFSDVSIDVSEYYKDNSEQYKNEIIFLQDGNSSIQFEENQLLKEGDECILYLKVTESGSLIIMGGPQGRMDITNVQSQTGESLIVEKHMDKFINEKMELDGLKLEKKSKVLKDFEHEIQKQLKK